MKKVFFSILAMIVASIAFSQQADSKLFEKYSYKQLENLRTKAPGSIDYMNFYVNNVAYIVDIPNKPIQTKELKKIDPKTGKIKPDQITMSDLQDFNPYLFNCEQASDHNTFYKAGNTGKVVVMRSQKYIERKFRQYQQNNKNK